MESGIRTLVVKWWPFAVIAALLVAVAVLSITTASASQAAAVAGEDSDREADSLRIANEKLRRDVEKYLPVYNQSLEIDARAEALEQKALDMAELEESINARTAEVEAREAAVFDRESAADWWTQEVRECLARGGSYQLASVSDGNLGRNVTCSTG